MFWVIASLTMVLPGSSAGSTNHTPWGTITIGGHDLAGVVRVAVGRGQREAVRAARRAERELTEGEHRRWTRWTCCSRPSRDGVLVEIQGERAVEIRVGDRARCRY